MVNLNIFVSYSSTDAKIAGEIKKCLEEFGQDVFLAHDDIQSGSQWETEILKNLTTTDVFMSLETENLQGSRWCQQEIGVAIEKKLIIIPLLVAGAEVKPTGFHGKYQGFRIHLGDLRESMRRLLIQQGIIEDTEDTVAEKRILALERSNSWKEAGENAGRVVEVEDQLSAGQKIRVARAALSNPEVSGSFLAMNTLRPFLQRWVDVIPAEVLKKVL